MSEHQPPPSNRQSPPSTDEPSTLEPAVDPRAPARKIHRRGAVGFLAGLSASLPLAASFLALSPRRRPVEPVEPAKPPMAPALRPRLMVVLPEETEQHYDLGHALGEYLNHGTDEALAPLAAVDFSCISAGEIELPVTAIGEGPLALLLISGDTRRLVRFELPRDEIHGYGNEAKAELVIDKRMRIVSSAIHQAVIDGDQVIGLSPRMLAHARVQEIATRARAGYAIADWRTDYGQRAYLDETTGKETGGEPKARSLMPDEAAHFAPALLAVALSVKGAGQTSLMSTLVEVARRRVVRGEVPGAEWATAGGCGTSFENRETHVGYACGMGHVPERSRRFLHFYTLKPSDW